MSKKKILTLVVLVILFGGLSYFIISPFFTNKEVQDALPPEIVTSSPLQETVVEEVTEVSTTDNQVKGTPAEPPQEIVQPPKELSPVMGTPGHPAEGTARIIETTEGTIIRYENFKTINGPILHVYLSKDLEAKEFVDLGKIKGTSGNINYKVPADVDVSEYKYVLTWCIPFRVLFNYAEIN